MNGSDIVLHNFALQACPMLVPILLDQLTKQDEDQELDECSWTLSMEAGVCLSLMSECVGSPIIPIVMPYVRVCKESFGNYARIPSSRQILEETKVRMIGDIVKQQRMLLVRYLTVQM